MTSSQSASYVPVIRRLSAGVFCFIMLLTTAGSVSADALPKPISIAITTGAPDVASAGDLLSSTYLGGTGQEGADNIPEIDVAIDINGDVFVVGITRSTDFPTTPGAYQTAFAGGDDVFIAKFDGNLTTLLAATLLGGVWAEWHPKIATDSQGNVYVSGSTCSADFPVTSGAFTTELPGYWDHFVSKLDGDLTTLLASTFVGGDDSEDFPCDMTLDHSGNIVIAGYTADPLYPTTSGAYDQDFNGGASDLFVSKFASNLTALLGSTFIGGSAQDERSVGVATDTDGNIFVLASTGSADYPTTAAAYDTSFNGPHTGQQYDLDLCVSKLDNDLTTMLASTFLGGGDFERAYAMTVDQFGDVFVTGHTSSTDYPTSEGAYDDSHNGDNEVFVTRLDNDLTEVVGSTYFTPGSAGSGYFTGIVSDAQGHIWLAGFTDKSTFAVTDDAFNSGYNGGQLDALLVRLGRNCDELLYATFFGGSDRDLDAGIAVDLNGVILAGYSRSSNVPIIGGGFDALYDGNQDAYLARFLLSCCGTFTGGMTGNSNCDEDGKRNLADISKLIDRVYLSKATLCCEANGNVNGDIERKINLADISRLIDHVYLSKEETAACL